MNCPICSAGLKHLSDARFGYCAADKLVVNLAYQPLRYEEDYFNKEYKNQYGRTYTADRQAILERNRIRHEQIKPFFTAKTHPQLLEVGSAAGYFLKIMQEEEFSVRGWEISDTMSQYANARGLKTTKQDFFKGAKAHAKKNGQPYDVLAMFYVLEHLADQQEAWSQFQRMVRPGGFLLIAMPSAAGPTFRFHRKKWYETHPIDHAVDYTPAGLRAIGARFGFELRAAFSEGKHPQRFPLGRFAFIQRLYMKALESAAISDTIFAVMERTA